jgi:hypothetical protein
MKQIDMDLIFNPEICLITIYRLDLQEKLHYPNSFLDKSNSTKNFNAMKKVILLAILFVNIFCGPLSAQHISEFNSLEPAIQDTDLFLPSTHSF